MAAGFGPSSARAAARCSASPFRFTVRIGPMQTEEMVYVIDDDEAARDSLRTVLTAAGVRVETYPSAVTFLSALPVIESGTVVSDVRMLDMTGIELLQELKRRHVDMP